MRILVDLGHPAHFHLLKHAIVHLRRDNDVVVIARQKDCLPDLLAQENIPFHLVPRRGLGLAALGGEALRALALGLRLAWRKPFDLLIGNSIVIGPLARLTGGISVVFNEDDCRAVPLQAFLAYRPAHYVVTPRCLKFENYGLKHLTYGGYEEMAYLHPNRFRPDPSVRGELGLGDGERFFVVRLVALIAHHDIGQKGLSHAQARQIVDRLAREGKVFLSAESCVDDDLRPFLLPTPASRFPHVLAAADLVVGDSQTVTAEAAVLGTPALRCNTFVGRLAYLEELEHRYGLTKGFLPDQFDALMAQLEAWLSQPDLKPAWRARRKKMLADSVDLTDWILDLLHRLGLRQETHGARPGWAPVAAR